MPDSENRFTILKVNTRKYKTRDLLLNIKTKSELVDSLVRQEITYYNVNATKYSLFIKDMEKNPFIRGHIKHINIYKIYS